jgi:hypothetical protein
LVSFAAFVIGVWGLESKYPENKKPTASSSGDGLMSAGVKNEFLGQQPPRASAHACTTTTSAAAQRAKIAAI